MTLPLSHSESEFNKNVDDVPKSLGAIEDDVNSCLDAYNNKGWWGEFTMWFAGVLDQVEDALALLVQGLAELGKIMLELASPGNPFAMLLQADGWIQVKNILSGQTGEFNGNLFPATRTWTGEAGWQYANVISAQSAAVGGIFPQAGNLGQHLYDHAVQVINGWCTIGDSMVKYTTTMAKDVGAFLTLDPTDWLGIIKEIVILVADIVQFIADMIIELREYGQTTVDQMFGLHNGMADASGSRGGLWPPADFA